MLLLTIFLKWNLNQLVTSQMESENGFAIEGVH